MSIRIASVITATLLLSGVGYSAAQAQGQGPGSAGLGSKWADAEKMPDLFSGKWMTFDGFVVAEKSLNVPYTPAAQKYVDNYKHTRDIPYAQEGCKTPGLPLSMRVGGGLKFTYAPGLISIYQEGVGQPRFIKMNRPHGKTEPLYYGNSIGHFEGDTLVVESIDFINDITFQYGVGEPLPPEEGKAPSPNGLLEALSAGIWGPHGEKMRMVERMRMVDPDTLDIHLTVYDDTVWTKPYVSSRQYRRIQTGKKIEELPGQLKGLKGAIESMSGEPKEWVCSLAITTFDPKTNSYQDADPEEMVKKLEGQTQ